MREAGPQEPGRSEISLSRRLAGLVAVAPAILVLWQTRTSGFLQDDLVNLSEAQNDALSVDYLLRATSGHFAPGHRLGDWLLQALFPFDFLAAQMLLAAMFALSLVVFRLILRELCSSNRWTLIVTLLYGVSMVHVGVMQWWASGLDRVPATLFSFLAVLFYLRFHRTGSRRYVMASLAMLAVALLFYVKPVFVPLYLILLRVFLVEPGRPLRETIRDVADEWGVWAAYGAVVVAYSAVYLSAYPSYPTDRSVGTVARYLGTLWSRVLVPNLFGLYVPPGDLTLASVLAVVGAHTLLVVIVIRSMQRWQGAWRAWAFFVLAALPNAVIIGLTRITVLPATQIAYATFFNLELVVLFFVAVSAAFFPRLAGVPEAASKSPGPVDRLPHGLLAPGIAGCVVLSLWGGWRIGQPGAWRGALARTYVDRMRHDLGEARRGGAAIALVDGIVSPDVSVLLAPPWNNLSQVVPLFDRHVTFDVAGRDLFSVSPTGRVEPVTFSPESGGSVPTLLANSSMAVIGTIPRITGEGACVSPGTGGATVGFDQGSSFDGDAYVELEYVAVRESEITMAPHPMPMTVLKDLEVPRFHVIRDTVPGRHMRVIHLGGTRTDRLALSIPAGAEICLKSLRIGRLSPRT